MAHSSSTSSSDVDIGPFASTGWPQLWRRLATFIVAVMIAVEGTGHALDRIRHEIYGGTLTTINVALRAEPAILIVGSSTAVHHFDDEALTAALGARVYNAGSDGRGVVFGRAVLALVCARERLQVVVVDVRRNKDELSRSQPNLAPFVDDSAVVREILDHDWANRVMLSSHGFRYNGAALPALAKLRARFVDRSWGFLPLDATYDPTEVVRTPSPSPDSVPWYSSVIREDHWYAAQLVALVQEARACGAEVMFVESPNAAETERQPNVLSLFHRVADEHSVPYLDFGATARPALRDPTLFADAGHLNVKGARLITAYLQDELLRRRRAH